jgi:peroxiredoxin
MLVFAGWVLGPLAEQKQAAASKVGLEKRGAASEEATSGHAEAILLSARTASTKSTNARALALARRPAGKNRPKVDRRECPVAKHLFNPTALQFGLEHPLRADRQPKHGEHRFPNPFRRRHADSVTESHIELASGAAERAPKVGDKAPAFSLRDPDGNEVSSTEFLSQGAVTFYRAVWCPYCNMDLQALQAALPELEKSGAKLVAISPQTAANHRQSRRENRPTFSILSDPHNEGSLRPGFKLPDYLIDLYRNAFENGLAVVNGDASWTLPVPARFVIAQDATILYAEVDPDYNAAVRIRQPSRSALQPRTGRRSKE